MVIMKYIYSYMIQRNNTEKARIYFDEMGKDFRLFMKNHFDLLSSELDAIVYLLYY